MSDRDFVSSREKGDKRMFEYNISQWVLFFMWYCFVGWVWESCYVSAVQGIKTKRWRWINRGFLNGPFLPIYGSAAVVILIATIPVKEYLWLVYIFGALAATLLELVTGTVMERLFKVKYWDYSGLPLNFHGHICLFISMFWGLCGILMTEVIHIPVEQFVLKLPTGVTEFLAVVTACYFTYDFTVSFRAAMDMREILERLTENNESLQRLERRLDAMVAFTPIPDVEELREKSKNATQRVIAHMERRREHTFAILRKMREYLVLPEAVSLPDKEELLEQVEKLAKSLFSRSEGQYLRVVKHLKHNPGAISRKYQKALEEIKELLEK